MADQKSTLYYGDNLEILRRYVAHESVTLTYLDPPFNSAQDYNVFFAERDGSPSAAQIRAFEDTWKWDQIVGETFEEVVVAGGKVSECMQTFRQFLRRERPDGLSRLDGTAARGTPRSSNPPTTKEPQPPPSWGRGEIPTSVVNVTPRRLPQRKSRHSDPTPHLRPRLCDVSVRGKFVNEEDDPCHFKCCCFCLSSWS